MHAPLHLAPLALALACACAGPRELERPALSRLAVHRVEARAELAREGLARPAAEPVLLRPQGTAEGALELRARLAALELDAARRLAGWSPGDDPAFTTRLEEAEALLRACAAEPGARLEDPAAIALAPGEPGCVRLLDQVAYVRSFELDLRGGALIADPVVGVFTEGVAITARAEPVAGPVAEPARVRLALEVELARLCRPIPEYEARALGGAHGLTIQQPVAAVQRIDAAVELAPEECLVLVRPALDGSGRFLLLFVAVRPAPAQPRLTAG